MGRWELGGGGMGLFKPTGKGGISVGLKEIPSLSEDLGN